MPYGKLLYRAIVDKKMTMAELSRKLGLKDHSYISRVINGTRKPPLDNTNKKIAKILGIDERELIIEAYFDRAPQEIKQMLYVIINGYKTTINGMIEYTQSVFKDFDVQESLEDLINEIKNEPISKLIISIIEQKEATLKMAQKVGEMFRIEEIDENGIISTLKFEEPFSMILADDGMAPNYPKNSLVKFQVKDNYKNGDYVCINENEKVILRQLIIHNNYYTFMPINTKEYEPMQFTKEDGESKIIAQAKEIIIKL